MIIKTPHSLFSDCHSIIWDLLRLIKTQEGTHIQRRIVEGIEKARQKGTKIGRSPVTTSTENEEILALRNQGMSLREIAKTFNISKSTVGRTVSRTTVGKIIKSQTKVKT